MQKNKYASLNNFNPPIIRIIKIQNRCVDSALTMSKCSLPGRVQLPKRRQVVLSETTKTCCLASAGLSGREHVYLESCVRSASPVQMSEVPKVAGWASGTFVYARKWRNWAESILRVP